MLTQCFDYSFLKSFGVEGSCLLEYIILKNLTGSFRMFPERCLNTHRNLKRCGMKAGFRNSRDETVSVLIVL